MQGTHREACGDTGQGTQVDPAVAPEELLADQNNMETYDEDRGSCRGTPRGLTEPMKVSMSPAFLGSFAPASSSSDRMDHTAEPSAQADNEARDLPRQIKFHKTEHRNETEREHPHNDEGASHWKASAMNL